MQIPPPQNHTKQNKTKIQIRKQQQTITEAPVGMLLGGVMWGLKYIVLAKSSPYILL